MSINILNVRRFTTGIQLDDALAGAQISTPANPPTGYNKLYFKSDDNLYSLNSAGVETEIAGGGGGGGVSSFNGRNGVVTLLSSDVTTSLTFTPANKAGDTFTGKINTVAPTTSFASIKFTSGVAPTTPVSGDFWNQSGSLKFYDGSTTQTLAFSSAAVTSFNTRVGAVTLTSGDVTTALTFTPATVALDNLSGVAINSALLPGSDNSIALGSSSKRWSALHSVSDVLYGSTSGTITQQANNVTTSYSVKWPAAQGASSTFLANDGSGNLSWLSSGTSAPLTLTGSSNVVQLKVLGNSTQTNDIFQVTDNASTNIFSVTNSNVKFNQAAGFTGGIVLQFAGSAFNGQTAFITKSDSTPVIMFNRMVLTNDPVNSFATVDWNNKKLLTGSEASALDWANRALTFGATTSASWTVNGLSTNFGIELLQLSSGPATPQANYQKIYLKTDTFLYRVNSSDVEVQIADHSSSDDFTPKTVATRGSPTLITAVGGISFSGTHWKTTNFIAGNAGPITVTATPQITAGTVISQDLILIGRDATNTVTLSDGIGLSLSASWIGGLNSVLNLTWDGSVWVETSRR